jgi:cytochrome c oxidase subunit IV
MTSSSSPSMPGASRARQYVLVFFALAVITAIEILMTQMAIAASTANALFLAFSLAKATLVAAFFMQLRDDSRIYTAIFLLPVILVLAFSTLMLMSAGGH